jgi:hypothetical protein
MNIKYLLILFPLLVFHGSHSMEKEPRNHQAIAIWPTMEHDRECLICNETAEVIEREKGSTAIRRTTCCNQLICADCLKKMDASNIKQCPNCRRNEELFKTSNAKVNQDNSKPYKDLIDKLTKEKYTGPQY